MCIISFYHYTNLYEGGSVMNSYKIANLLFARMLKITVWLFSAFIILETISFSFYAKTVNQDNTRFEKVLANSWIHVIFYTFFVLILIAYAVVIFSFYWGNKSIYTLLSLPIRPSGLVSSFVIVCAINLLFLFALQLFLIICFGGWLPSFFKHDLTTETFTNNYLFLAALRFTPLSYLFPISFYQVITLLLLLITPGVTVAYTIFISISRKFRGFWLIGLWLIFAWRFLTGYFGGYYHLYSTAFLTLTTIFIFYLMIKYVKGRVIV